jgi:FMN phosphatase YigB (HAD superfamily)
MLKALIFDWGRTLYDNEQDALFPEASGTVTALARHYTLAIVSLVSGDYAARRDQRLTALHQSGLEQHFAAVEFVAEDKDAAYERVLAVLGTRPEEVAIVDDRAVRGIGWGNRRGATTIWLRRGRFADELPDDDTGPPTHTITNIAELPIVLGG